MKFVCEKGMCNGCKACVEMCPSNAIVYNESIRESNCCIEENKCINCNKCKKICPRIQKQSGNEPVAWYQGWAKSREIRSNSSSGGIATEITRSFIEDGGYVCSCLYKNGEFVFDIVNSLENARCFSGSKYVKSNPGESLKNIKKLLKNSEKVLFIGLPCQVAGLLNIVSDEEINYLYTIDLICHGTPSVKTLELYLEQHNINRRLTQSIVFRSRGHMGMCIDGKPISPMGVTDKYLISFLKAANYTENCYKCEYSSVNRVADITLGDNWGTNYADELKDGVSLILCNSKKGEKLIEKADLFLDDVDIKKAVDENHQLQHPSIMTIERNKLLSSLEKNENYDKTVRQLFFSESVKQFLKGLLMKIGLYS